MSDWRIDSLSDVINIIGGGTPKRNVNEFWNGEINWLSVADFNDDNRFVNSSAETITELGLEKSSAKLLEKGQLIISARGTVGCLAQLSKPMAFNQSCYGLTGKAGVIDNGFLYYFLKNNIAELKRKTHGAVFDTITRDTFKNIEIKYPKIEKQIEIAKKLGAFDKKIQLNKETNQTLEAIAQALFKSWFIDFDPVRAKAEALANGKTKTQATIEAMKILSGKTTDQLTQLAQDNPEDYQRLQTTAEAFPSGFDDTGIPLGWEVKSLSDTIQVIGGGTPKRSNADYWNGNIFWFSVKDVPSAGNVFVIETEEKITELGLVKSSTKLLPSGTTIITARGTVGKLALLAEDMCMNQSCYGLRGKNVGDYFNYFNIKSAINELKSNTHGAVFDTITIKTFASCNSVCFDSLLADIFENTVSSLMEKIKNSLHENKSLRILRDTLLPKVLSGEIEI